MAIIYRTAGPWGVGKGANLVPAEVDGNFYDVAQRLVDVENGIPEAANGIGFFSVSGNLFNVHMTNGTIQGPFVLPKAAWNFRDAWTPSTAYSVDDVVTANGSVYLVLFNHVSAAEFDEGANDGSGQDYYGKLLTNPDNVMPPGGEVGQYLVKTEVIDFGVAWETPVVFPSQKLLEAPDATYDLTLTNIASYVRCTNVAGCTITIPADAALNFPLSSEISFRQCTAGGVELVADTDVILNTIAGLSAKTGRNGAVITAKKIAADTWDVFGLLTA